MTGFNNKVTIMLGTHEAHAKLAEAWFTFLGFVAVTSIFHAAAEKTNSLQSIGLKWICYLLLFNWVYYKISKLIWFIYPPSDIENGRPKNIVIGISVWISFMAMLFTYQLSLYLFKVFIDVAS